MVKIEEYITREDGVVLVRAYSDNGHYILDKVGHKYEEAVDPKSAKRTYTESDEMIPPREEEYGKDNPAEA